MRILLVSYAFPPFNSIGAAAVGRLTKGLIERGNEVFVVGAGNSENPPTMPLDTGATEVHWVDDPLRLPARSRLRGAAGRLGRRLLPRMSIPDVNRAWITPAVRMATQVGAEARAEVVVASGPPHSALVAGATTAHDLDVPLVLNLRDLWMDNPYRDASGHAYVRNAIERQLERRVINRAAAVFTSTDLGGEILAARYPDQRILTLMNGIDAFPSDAPEMSPPAGLVIVHTGLLYSGARDPSPLFGAMRRLSAAGVSVEARFYGLDVDCVAPIAAREGVAHLVRVHGRVGHDEALRAQRAADVLLVLQRTDDRDRAVCPGKLFEYLGSRRPVLSVGPTGGIVDTIVTSTGSGLVSADRAEITEWLRDLAVQRTSGARIPDLPVEPVLPYARRHQIDRFDAELRDIGRSSARVS